MEQYFSRTGDDGYTGVLGEGRLPKYHPRLEAVGSVDEASAALGLARALSQAQRTRELILTIQRDLYNLMAEVAALPENAARFRTIGPDRLSWLEDQIEVIGKSIENPKGFTVAGDTPAGAALDVARTVVRRAERRLAELYHRDEIENLELLRYLNRLSSLCYVLEGVENAAAGKDPYTLAKE